MKTIFLVRHAKCVSKKRRIPDFERSLIPKGEKGAKGMAKQLKKEGLAPDLMISSPANRTLETAHIFAGIFDYPVHKIMLKEAIYDKVTAESLLDVVREVDDKYHSIMLFGHNPSLNDFACLLLKDFQDHLPKAGVVGIDFKINSWKEISKAGGKLKLFNFPIDKTQKAEIVKRVQEELGVKILEQMNAILNEIDPAIAKKMKKYLKKSSQKLAQKFIKIAENEIVKAKSKTRAMEEVKSEPKKSTDETKDTPTQLKEKTKSTKGKSMNRIKTEKREPKLKPEKSSIGPKDTRTPVKENTKPDAATSPDSSKPIKPDASVESESQSS